VNSPTWIDRPLDCDFAQRRAAWAHRAGSLLLDDVQGHRVLLFAPRWIVRLEQSGHLHRIGTPPPHLPLDGNPADWPARWIASLPRARRDRPIFCGIAGHLSYELGTLGWHVAAARPARVATPMLWLAAYDRALVLADGVRPRLVVARLEGLVEDPRPLERIWESAREELLSADIAAQASPARRPVEIESLDPVWHRRSVERIHRYLRAGDVYQINLTGQVLAHSDLDPFEVYEHECARNPAPYAAFAQLGDLSIASHSPERLLRLRGSRATSSPIKGTAAAGDDTLHASVKDRAEHVMIVDLVRNDLGRSAVTGSVRVASLMHAMRLRGLEHLVSDVEATVRGRAREHILGDLFPGGSITGAPKRRAIEIIAELESCRRGVYTGSIGYADRAGNADWNIAIRTAVWQNGRVAFGCGGGIVLDSDPDREYAEALLKARSFLESLREVERRRRSETACSSISTEA